MLFHVYETRWTQYNTYNVTNRYIMSNVAKKNNYKFTVPSFVHHKRVWIPNIKVSSSGISGEIEPIVYYKWKKFYSNNFMNIRNTECFLFVPSHYSGARAWKIVLFHTDILLEKNSHTSHFCCLFSHLIDWSL